VELAGKQEGKINGRIAKKEGIGKSPILNLLKVLIGDHFFILFIFVLSTKLNFEMPKTG